jgi:hypothetical protein
MKFRNLILPALLASVGLNVPVAQADPLYIGTPSPVAPVPSSDIPTFKQVPGKEYTDFLD